jgi:hypothetical protein
LGATEKKEKRKEGQAFQKIFSCMSFAAMIRTKREVNSIKNLFFPLLS